VPPSLSWLEVYAPLERLDAGLCALLAVWVAVVVAGVAISLRGRARSRS
jgi:hypothetical protein